MFLDGVPYPPLNGPPASDTLNWKVATSAISLINHLFVNGTCQAGEDPVNSPSEFHCFHVSGASLKALFPSSVFNTGTHTITLFYAAHLANSTVWTNGREALLGCVGPNYVSPFPSTMPDNAAYGTDAYSGGSVCTPGEPG